ncbi:LysM peptidoglycan-binding domain-containing protein [Kineococcus auxinigenes]|uniref:LysM peptidoglycan-binding domain-containing protein n=1 Tax=unclassified Kineococcus TaxID=2621656 RepID=UPI003D7EAFF0
MLERHPAAAGRTGAVLAVGAALAALPVGAAAGVGVLSAPAVRSASAGTASTADLLTALCGTAACLLLLALAGSVLLAAVAEARERSAAARGRRAPVVPAATRAAPAPVRRVVALVVGLALGTGVASAASAAPRGPEAGWAAAAPQEPGPVVPADLPADLVSPGSTGDVDPAWASLPDLLPAPRGAPVLPPAELPGGVRPSGAGADLVVQRGDSLWSLARELSGPGARDADVLHELQRLYAANADVIGEDPDVLLPGQVLRLP